MCYCKHCRVTFIIFTDSYNCDQCEFQTGDFMLYISHKNEHTAKKKQRSLFTCGKNLWFIIILIFMFVKMLEISDPLIKQVL